MVPNVLPLTYVGFGIAGKTVFAAQAQREEIVFRPYMTYNITFGAYEEGRVLDVGKIWINELPFTPSVPELNATLNPDITWTFRPR